VIEQYARQAVSYVEQAVGLAPEYDSDTLPVVDHYLRAVPEAQQETVARIVSTTGAYFGEVVRRQLGGRWDLKGDEPTRWRLILPSGLSFVPAGIVAAAIVRSDNLDELDTGFDVPPRMRPHLELALARMSPVTEDEYFSLCGRLDTLEHVQEVLVAIALELSKSSDP